MAQGFSPVEELTPAAVEPPDPTSAPVEPAPVPDPVKTEELTIGENPAAVITRSDSSVIIPSDSLTIKPSNSDTVRLLHSVTVKQSDSQAVLQSSGDTVLGVDRQTVLQQDSHTVVATPPAVQSYNIPLDVLTLTYIQAAVLDHLIKAGGTTNARNISVATHIVVPSVRDALRRLEKRGFIAKPVAVRDATFQGFSYVLNKTLVQYFLDIGGVEQSNYTGSNNDYNTVLQTDRQTVLQSDCHTVRQPDGQTTHSSSSLKELTTTTQNQQTVSPSYSQTVIPSDNMPITRSDNNAIRPSDSGAIKPSGSFVLSGLVESFWGVDGEGLQESQAQKWCEQFEVEPAAMRQMLEWARHDLEINGKREDVRKDPISWFFGHLRQTGGYYPRPANYKSPLELRAEAMEQEIASQKAAMLRVRTAELEGQFQQILANPTSGEYRSVFSRLNGFEQTLDGSDLEQALRTKYLELRGIHPYGQG